MPRGKWHSSLAAECSGYGVASGLLGGSRRRRSFSADEVEVQDRVGLDSLTCTGVPFGVCPVMCKRSWLSYR